MIFCSLKDTKSLHMLDHFDMTSNNGIDCRPNSLRHDYLSKYYVSRHLESLNFCLPILGWFNDEHCKLQDFIMRFTYICKLGCNNCCWNITDDIVSYYNNYLCRGGNKTRNSRA